MEWLKNLLKSLIKNPIENPIKNSKKYRYLILGIFLLISLTIIFVVILFFNISPAETALVKLAASFSGEISCHEKCNVFRQNQEKIIIAGFKTKPQKLDRMMLNYWRAKEINSDFKKELIKLSALAYGADNPPEYFKNYLLDSGADLSLVREIISQFNLTAAADSLSGGLEMRIENASSSAEKIEALKTLGKLGADAEIDNYFNLLNSAEAIEIKKEAIKNLSNIREKSIYFTLAQLDILKKLIISPSTDIRIRQELVLLIGDYYLVFPLESASAWQEIYANKSLDNISRSFSADSLNHLKNARLVLPVVSETDWAAYYNQ
jgi:hypothetical protein